jgi:hypothetical protein
MQQGVCFDLNSECVWKTGFGRGCVPHLLALGHVVAERDGGHQGDNCQQEGKTPTPHKHGLCSRTGSSRQAGSSRRTGRRARVGRQQQAAHEVGTTQMSSSAGMHARSCMHAAAFTPMLANHALRTRTCSQCTCILPAWKCARVCGG